MQTPATLVPPRWMHGLLLALLTLAAHVLVLSNPGYFSHDEWQKVDAVRDHGYAAFAADYGKVVAGPEFGYPVRPIGFLQQALSATWMTRSPVLPHLLDVLLHTGIVLLFWRLVLSLRLPQRTAGVAAVVLAVAPLGTLATAWVAASFDRWYLLFFLVAAAGWLRATRRPGVGGLALILVGSAGAILSKETAVVLPGALLLVAACLWLRGEGLPSRGRLAAMLACAIVPVAWYMMVRWPALQATLASHGGPYSPSPARVPGNALLYFAYPFVPGAIEGITLPLLPRWQFLLGLLVHAGLVLALWRRAGFAWSLAYLAGYFVFLVPVLMLPAPGAHYLYGAGPAFALAFAAVLSPRAGGARDTHGALRLAVPVMVMVSALAMRSLWIQQSVYSEGRCQSEFLASYEPLAEAAVAKGATRIVLGSVPGTRDYVATKVMFGRTQFMPGGRWPTARGGGAERPGDAYLVMQPDCRVAWR
jgi:hypothetical protein